MIYSDFKFNHLALFEAVLRHSFLLVCAMLYVTTETSVTAQC
jgi:hypothetical protein